MKQTPIQHLQELIRALPNSDYKGSLMRFENTDLPRVILDIEKRLNDLEHKNKKNKRIKATRAQKMLLFYHLGLLDKLLELPLSTNKKARLLSVILDEDQDNLEGDISTVGHSKSDLRKDFNYKFLVTIFEELGLEDFAALSEKILTQIQTEKESKNKK